MSLNGKNILIGVSGSIAAYKVATLVRLLIKQGAEARVIMTESATGFITPLTLSTLSKHPVMLDVSDGDTWNNHVDLGLWADVMLVAPATANTLAKMAHGIADNMLVATYLSSKCPVYISPAMDLDMWKHGSTKHNLERLKSYGNTIIPVGHGELASGLVGEGRMAEPEDIVDILSKDLGRARDMEGQTVIVTAGPTYEPLDPVRFIGNHSSGKMGIAIAEECASRGAQVHLVLGPTHLSADNQDIHTHRIMSAQEMHDTCISLLSESDVAIMAAAVADYTPAVKSDVKIKKSDGDMKIDLQRTPDIAGSIGAIKGDRILVGFALETNNEEQNALGKLKRKNFDFIVLNSLKNKGAGFKHDTNQVTIIRKDGSKVAHDLKAKKEVAKDILDEVVALRS